MTRAPVWIVLVILLLSPGVAAAWDFPWDKKKGPVKPSSSDRAASLR